MLYRTDQTINKREPRPDKYQHIHIGHAAFNGIPGAFTKMQTSDHKNRQT